ncbi:MULTISPECIES: HPF/RaiA family ribosome-associated protein [unclassified Legionella]|uniref:HPF/RaiA family ribosome-associated protein n=1 Tax=unclassified Legionella TaxID=2622702 RepID=UPI001055921F|nr:MULTISPECIES: HPF/RaiA family ribosome-associated protein [unclassified Legionella]MDI9819011.1 HPF/RaiA family ribosome-associated protein [Legionella sp. PL877]
MKLPIQVVFRNMDPSPAAEDKARSLANKLDRYYDRIMSCRVVIEAHHRHHYKGNIYHVRIDLTLPHSELVVSRDPSQNHAHEDVYVAIRDAFNAIKRQLQDHVDKQRGRVKHHEPTPQGRITEIYPPADYGYIETIDGRRLRFTSSSVVDYDFESLEIGDRVSFIEAENTSAKETAASTVYIENKNSVADRTVEK